MAAPASRREWLAGLAAAAAAIGIAMWTGSRGAMLAVVATSIAGLLFAPAMRSARAWGGALASMGIALSLVAVAPSVQNRLMGLERTVTATAQPDVTTGRTAIWANAVGAIQHRPLFGYGEGQMRVVAPFSIMVQPHNVLLQVAFAWGLLGLACVLVLALAFVARALPAVGRDEGMLTPAFLAMTALATLSLYDGALYSALPISMFMAFGGSVASGWRPVAASRPEPLASGDSAPAGAAQG
jgi:O-antigen ligase